MRAVCIGRAGVPSSVRTFARAAALILGLCVGASPVSAQSAEDTVRKLEDNQVYDTCVLDATLSVSNRFGRSESAFTTWARKGGDTLIEITAGPDRGQKVLRQQGNIYLYYPEAEDVIWLKGSALKDSMMGSDFSYEDLTDDGTILGRFTVRLVGTETVDGAECIRLVLEAKTRNEAYAKQELWVDSRLFVTRRAILYSAAGKPIRELSASDIRTVSGKNVPFRTEMRDLLKKNTSTVMTISRIEIGVPVAEKYFNRETLSW